MQNTETTSNITPQQDGAVQIRELVRKCLSRWYWFAASLAVCLAFGVLYILRSTPTYSTSAEIQIKSDSKGASMPGDVSGFGDMGLFSVKSNVNNELRAFESPDLMGEVVDRLKLHVDYSVDGLFHPTVLYGADRPVSAEFLDVEENVAAGFTVSEGSETITLRDFVFKGGRLDGRPVSGHYSDTLQTPVGRIVVQKTKDYSGEAMKKPVNVRKSGQRGVTQSYLNRLQVNLADKNADIIALSIKDVSTQRAQDILNTLIAVYNENWVRDKNQIANSTSVFINDRLRVIEGELAGVDSDISAYKSENMIPDVGAAATMYMQQSTVLNQQLQDVSNQLYMARYIKDYIGKEDNRNQPLPANMGLSSQTIENGISEYNSKILQRNNLVANSGEENVLVKDLDQALASMRGSISRSIDNEILALNTKYENLKGTARQNTARIAANPNQAKQLLSVERQQTVKQALYLFLLQKREENELSQAFTAYNTRIIKHPISGIFPVSPQSMKIMMMAFLLGLMIPAGIIYLLMATDTKVRSRRDLKGVSVPFAGEIPLSAAAAAKAFGRRKTLSGADSIVVRHGNRDVVNEAFRVLRTNLEFMMREPGSKVVAVTSFNPGSGKSFMSSNLAVCFAIKGKRVLAIDGDLRHGTLSELVGSPKPGLSDYLAGIVADVHDVIVRSKDAMTVPDTLPAGSIPPNPAELVADRRFADAIAVLRNEYDVIVIDCPPVEIVTDARVINDHVDRTLFVVRAGLFDKAMLPDLDALYRDGKYRGLCYVLNGTASSDGYYGNYGTYGHYGYYGHNGGSYYSSDNKAR